MSPIKSLIFGASSQISKELYQDLSALDHEIYLYGKAHPEWAKNDKKIDMKKRFIVAPSTHFFSTDTNFQNIFFIGSPWSDKLFHNLSNEEIFEFINDGILVPIKIIKSSLPEMLRQGYGRIIFIGSSIVDKNQKGTSMYRLVKQSYKSLAASIAIEYGNFGISANVINLGLLEEGISARLPKNTLDNFKSRTSNQKSINAKNVSRVIVEVMNDANFNGAVLNYDSGFF